MPGILCEHCTGVCCRYIALPIDKPRTREDFDDIRWYLLHENIAVFVEDGDWYINIPTTCRHLQPDNRCGIYQTRPRICRDYSTDGCDYHSGDYGWQYHFTCPEHLDEYVRTVHRFPRRRVRGAAARAGAAARIGNGRVGQNSGARGAGRLRVRLGRPRPSRRPRGRPTDYAALAHDVRGVPLPILTLPPL